VCHPCCHKAKRLPPSFILPSSKVAPYHNPLFKEKCQFTTTPYLFIPPPTLALCTKKGAVKVKVTKPPVARRHRCFLRAEARNSNLQTPCHPRPLLPPSSPSCFWAFPILSLAKKKSFTSRWPFIFLILCGKRDHLKTATCYGDQLPGKEQRGFHG